MEYYNHIHCRYTGIKGFVNVYEYSLKYSYMVTEKAKYKLKVLAFWEKYGLQAATDAYNVKRRTLYLWKKQFIEGNKKIESLNEKSKKPKNLRKRITDPKIENFIIEIREKHHRLGKEKINVFLKENNIANISDSTVGRIIKNIKEKGKLKEPSKNLSFHAKTNNFHQKPKKHVKKLRRKDYQPNHQGDLLQIDTVVKFISGIKRYVITAIDIQSGFAFAYTYKSPNSSNTKDFFMKLQKVAPFKIKRIQTDNGSEFEKYFKEYIEKQKIIHFHNYPRCPKMNANIERFNRTIQEEFINLKKHILSEKDINKFNHILMDWLLWYNTERPHWSLGLISPMRYIVNSLIKQLNPQECNMYWTNTNIFQKRKNDI